MKWVYLYPSDLKLIFLTLFVKLKDMLRMCRFKVNKWSKRIFIRQIAGKVH